MPVKFIKEFLFSAIMAEMIRIVGFDEVIVPNRVFAREAGEKRRARGEPSKFYVHISRYHEPSQEEVLQYIKETAKKVYNPILKNNTQYQAPLESILSELQPKALEALAEGNKEHYKMIRRQLSVLDLSQSQYSEGVLYLMGQFPNLESENKHPAQWYGDKLQYSGLTKEGYGLQLLFWLKFTQNRLHPEVLPDISDIIDELRKGNMNSTFLKFRPVGISMEWAITHLNLLYESLLLPNKLKALVEERRKEEQIAIKAIFPLICCLDKTENQKSAAP